MCSISKVVRYTIVPILWIYIYLYQIVTNLLIRCLLNLFALIWFKWPVIHFLKKYVDETQLMNYWVWKFVFCVNQDSKAITELTLIIGLGLV